MKEILWPKAISSGSLSETIEFMQMRQNIPNCAGETKSKGNTWYMTPDIPNSTFCRACYEDGFMATPFGSKYTPQKLEGEAYCDAAATYCKRMFAEHTPTNNWTAYVQGMITRVNTVPCPKLQAVKSSERTCYAATKGPEGLTVCKACYYDYFYGTEDQKFFSEMTWKNPQWGCTLAILNIKVSGGMALIKKDRNIFWDAIAGVDKHEFCNPKGTKGTTWYTLPNSSPDFGICAGCYAGIVSVMGGTGYFVPKTGVPNDAELVCCFNQAYFRWLGCWVSYVESLIKGGPKPLLDWAAIWPGVPGCPADNLRVAKNRRWWGWDVCMICEECYHNYAKGTALEEHFRRRGERVEPWRTCDLFSTRMRNLYKEACETGALNDFLTFAQHRQMVFEQTMPVADQLLSQQRIKAMQARMAMTNGSFYKNLGWTHDAVVGHSYTVGNSSIGYGHANEWVAQGYGYDQQASALSADVMSGSWSMRIGELERRWNEVR